MTLKTPARERPRLATFAGRAEKRRPMTILTAAECRDKAEQKMIEAAKAARHAELRVGGDDREIGASLASPPASG